MALLVAGLIVNIGIKIVKTVFNHLTDVALPVAEEQQILEIIHQTMPSEEPVAIDALKTRRSGSYRSIVFNLRVSPSLTVEKAHYYCDLIEDALEKAFPQSLVTIHLEPLPLLSNLTAKL